MMTVVIITVFVLLTVYAALITYFWQGLRKVLAENIAGKDNKLRFTILTAARNEEDNITGLIGDIIRQDYPANLYEFILINDGSSDKTVDIAREMLTDSGVSFRILNSSGGKKAALALGLKHSANPYILITDADCRLPQRWIDSYNRGFSGEEIKIVSAPVFFETGNFFTKSVSLEFASLTASGAGAIGGGSPVMINGANMGVRRDVLLEMSDVYNSAEPSGDDMFMMQAIKKRYGKKAFVFLPYDESVVVTRAPETFKAFVEQRLRWASKSRLYSDGFLITTAMVVFLLNFFIAILPFTAVFAGGEYLILFLMAVLLKALIDLPLLYCYLGRFHRRSLIKMMLPVEFIYPFYIAFITIASMSRSYRWK